MRIRETFACFSLQLSLDLDEVGVVNKTYVVPTKILATV